MAEPMAVEYSGCGSSSARNDESNPLANASSSCSEQMVAGPFVKFHNVIDSIEHVQTLLSGPIAWNKEQCKRIAKRYIFIADMLKRIVRDQANSVVDEASDGGTSTSIEEVADILLPEVQKMGNFISGYTGESRGTMTNVVCRTNNPEAFKGLHEDLDAAEGKIGLQGMEEATELTSKMNMLEVDAEADKKEMLERFSQMSESAQTTGMNRDIVEKLAQVVSEKLEKYSAEKLPSYLNIAQTEIIIDEPVREYTRRSEQDPKHEEGWASVRKGKWLNCDFAIKVFKCGATDACQPTWNRRQMLMEAGSLVELQHPHVVRLVGFGQFEEQSIFVMELMDGGDLRHFMTTKLNSTPKPPKPFTDTEELDIIIQIAKGMYFIHTKGFMHGDLKCSNIVVKNHGHGLEVKIADFRGSQKRGDWNPVAFEQASKTRRPRWTAPEALDYAEWIKPEAPAPSWESLKQIDIYSFAMTCYEIVTGITPFDNIRGEDLLKQLKEGKRPELPEDLNEYLKGLVTSCWDEAPEKRPSFEIICQFLETIKLKTSAAEKDGPSRGLVTSGMVKFLLNQFRNTFKMALGRGGVQSELQSDLYAPEHLRIPEHLKIEPEQLTRGDAIGQGGSATVYKTTWLGCTFAEKILKKSCLVTESLQQEIESLIKVSRHPYVAQLVGLSINPGHGECSIIMEYINGNLRKLIDTRMKKRKGADGPRRGPFDLHEELLIISKIALGMAYLHSRGLVHRDLNPHNVLAQQSGIIDVKIVDFGISHLESSDIHVTYRYYTGMGTRFYRAPEMMPIDPKEDLSKLGLPDISSTADLQALKATDVFSFAMTCYEVLTGKAPFEAELSTGSMHESDYAKVRSEDRRPPWPARPDPEPKWSKLKSLVEGCWVRIPKDRPTFDKVCKELMEISRS